VDDRFQNFVNRVLSRNADGQFLQSVEMHGVIDSRSGRRRVRFANEDASASIGLSSHILLSLHAHPRTSSLPEQHPGPERQRKFLLHEIS
jgi:hypothetical protein